MGKIIGVDFKNKTKQFVWDDDEELRTNSVRKVAMSLQDALENIKLIIGNDPQYQKYCTKTLCDIVLNLQERI